MRECRNYKSTECGRTTEWHVDDNKRNAKYKNNGNKNKAENKRRIWNDLLGAVNEDIFKLVTEPFTQFSFSWIQNEFRLTFACERAFVVVISQENKTTKKLDLNWNWIFMLCFLRPRQTKNGKTNRIDERHERLVFNVCVQNVRPSVRCQKKCACIRYGLEICCLDISTLRIIYFICYFRFCLVAMPDSGMTTSVSFKVTKSDKHMRRQSQFAIPKTTKRKKTQQRIEMKTIFWANTRRHLSRSQFIFETMKSMKCFRNHIFQWANWFWSTSMRDVKRPTRTFEKQKKREIFIASRDNICFHFLRWMQNLWNKWQQFVINRYFLI